MRLTTFYRMSLVAVVLALLFALVAGTSQGAMKTMVVGSKWAVSARTPETSLAMAEILNQGGNAFDAAVAGQAVLGIEHRVQHYSRRRLPIMIWNAASEGHSDQRIWLAPLATNGSKRTLSFPYDVTSEARCQEL